MQLYEIGSQFDGIVFEKKGRPKKYKHTIRHYRYITLTNNHI